MLPLCSPTFPSKCSGLFHSGGNQWQKWALTTLGIGRARVWQHVYPQTPPSEPPQVCCHSRTPVSCAFLQLFVASVSLFLPTKRNISAVKQFLKTINVDYAFWHAPFMTTSPSGCVRVSAHKGNPAACIPRINSNAISHTPRQPLPVWAELQPSALQPGSGWICCLLNNSFVSRQDEQRNRGSGYSRLA